MQTQTLIPTTIRFQPGLLHRLKALATEQRKTLSQIVELSTRHFIEQQEQARIHEMYKGLFEIAAMSKNKGTLPVQNIDIDDELYGENGAWKGSNA